MKEKILTLKNDFKALPMLDKIFDVLVTLLMISAVIIQTVTDDDGFTTLQLGLNVAASLALFLCHVIFKKGSLLGSISLKAQKYISIIVLIGSFGGQFLGIGSKIENYDTFTHLITGSVVCFIALYLYEFLSKEKACEKPKLACAFCYFTSMAVALFWELFEFSSDMIFGSTCQGYNLGIDDEKFFYFRWLSFASRPEMQAALYDTFADLFTAFITATVTVIIISAVLKKQNMNIDKSASEISEADIFLLKIKITNDIISLT